MQVGIVQGHRIRSESRLPKAVQDDRKISELDNLSWLCFSRSQRLTVLARRQTNIVTFGNAAGSYLKSQQARCRYSRASYPSLPRAGVMPHGDGMRGPSTRDSNVIDIFATSRSKPTSAPVALPLESKQDDKVTEDAPATQRAKGRWACACKANTCPDTNAHCNVPRNANEHVESPDRSAADAQKR